MRLLPFYIFSYSFLYSLLEIEIEGKYGWAEKLPTVKDVLGTLTLYHVYMNSIVILTLLYSILLPHDSLTFVYYTIIWFMIEDTYWFIYNANYTLKKYKKEDIWWHGSGTWVGGVPLFNILGFIILLSIIGYKAYCGDTLLIYDSFILIGLCLLAMIMAPYYHTLYIKYH